MNKIQSFYNKNKFLTIALAIGLILGFFISTIVIVAKHVGPSQGQRIFEQLGKHPIIIKEIGRVAVSLDNSINVLERNEIGEIEYYRIIARGTSKPIKYAKIEFWINKSDSIWVLDSVNILETADTYRELKE